VSSSRGRKSRRSNHRSRNYDKKQLSKLSRAQRSHSSSKKSEMVSIKSKPDALKILSLLSKVKAVGECESIKSSVSVAEASTKKQLISVKDKMLLNDPRRATMNNPSHSDHEISMERNGVNGGFKGGNILNQV
jgi:hypothetical protein